MDSIYLAIPAFIVGIIFLYKGSDILVDGTSKTAVKLGISSRGLGSVKESMGSTVVQEDFELICFDMVSEPSTPNAYVYPKEQSKMYENKINEAKQNIVDDLFKKILED